MSLESNLSADSPPLPRDTAGPRSAILWAGLLGATFLFCYGGVLRYLASQWWSSNFYSYGFLIPCVSAYLVWVRRERLRLIAVRPEPVMGAIVLAGGLAALIAGHAAGVSLAEDLSIVIVLSGGVLLVLGSGYFRALLFPIGYLLFMVPFWDVFTSRLHAPFQMFSAKLGLSMLQAVGVPAAREGTRLLLPHITLVVAEVCSGVNFLIAVVAIGIPLAYLTLRSWTRRVLLVAFGVLVSILSNSFRIALIGILNYAGVGGDIHGPFHVLQGMFVAVIGYIALFAGASVLSRTERHRGTVPRQPIAPDPSGTMPRGNGSIAVPAIAVCAALALAGGYVNLYRPAPVPLARDLGGFPHVFGAWVARDAAPDDSTYRSFGADYSILRTYRREPGESVQFYMGYDPTQQQGRELINDKTELWRDRASPRTISLATGTTVRVSQVLQRRDDTNRIVLVWFDVNGRLLADRYSAKLYTAWNVLRRGKANGAVLLVAADYAREEDLRRAAASVESFAREVVPAAQRYLAPGTDGNAP